MATKTTKRAKGPLRQIRAIRRGARFDGVTLECGHRALMKPSEARWVGDYAQCAPCGRSAALTPPASDRRIR